MDADVSMEGIACKRCDSIICTIRSGTRKLGGKAIIATAKRDHRLTCKGLAKNNGETISDKGKCPVCCAVMCKRNIPKHCARVHRLELIQSMKAEDLEAAKKYNCPMVFGYHEGTRIVGACLYCERGGVKSVRDYAGLYQSYETWKRLHKDCLGRVPMDEFTHGDSPRKQLDHNVMVVEYASSDDEPEVPAGGAGDTKRPAPPKIDDDIIETLRNDVGLRKSDKADVSELIRDLYDSRETWKKRCLNSPFRNELVVATKERDEARKELATLKATKEECLKCAEPNESFRPMLSKETEALMEKIAFDEGIYFEDETKHEDICSYVFDEYIQTKLHTKGESKSIEKSEAIADEFRIIIHRLLEALADAEIPLRTALTATQESFLTNNL